MTGPGSRTATGLVERLIAGALHHQASLASLLMRAFGVAAGFIVTFLIGRWYGPAANGQYAIVTQTAMFLSIISVGGLDLAVSREFSRTAAEQRPLAIATFLRSLVQTIAVALLLCGGMLVAGRQLLDLMGRDAVPVGAVGVLCLILISRTCTRFLAAVLRSQSSFILAQAVEVLFIPLGTILLLVLGLARTTSEILWATATAGLVTAAIGIVASLRHTSRSATALTVSTGALFAVALPLWGAAITQNLADWYGLATISAVNGVYHAGLFRVAAQFASVFALVPTGLFGTFGTQISTAHHLGDRQRVAALAGSATRLSAVLVIPLAALVFIFAPQVMGVIGPEFRAGATMLRVLVLGQVAITLASPAGLVLAMTGHPRINFAFTGISALFMLITAPIVAHRFGATGVAALFALSLTGQNLTAHVFVRRLEGIDALTGRLVRRAAGSTD